MQQMNPKSRMWVYGLKSPLSAVQSEALKETMDSFVADWKAHGTALSAAYRWMNDQILVIAVDESTQQATGCSIDKSVHLLQEFGAKHGVDFFNRMLVHVVNEDHSFTSYTPTELKEAIASGQVNGSTRVVNTLAATLGESGDGTLALSESWAAKYL
jgi:hypothetical protein